MNLSSGLPYSTEVYHVLVADYMERWLSVVIAGMALALWLVWQSRTSHSPRMRLFIACALAAMALWVGLAHQGGLMGEMNFMAKPYAIAWSLFALWLLLRFGLFPSQKPQPASPITQRTGLGIMGTSLLVYPVLQWMTAVPLEALDLVGTGPNATAIFVFGALLASQPKSRPELFVFPVAWCGVAALHGYLLDMPADWLGLALVLSWGILKALPQRPSGPEPT